MNKDELYELLKNNPTKDNLIKYFKNHLGEMSEFDFKTTWTEDVNLAKLVLSMANSGGGIILVGIKETQEKIEAVGLTSIKDKEKIRNGIKKYLPDSLKFIIYDYVYDGISYEEFKNKKFQMMSVLSDDNYLPYLCQKDCDTKLEKGTIYVRKGTSNEKADNHDITEMVNKRVLAFKSNGDLVRHLDELESLYKKYPNTTTIQLNKAFGSNRLSEFESFLAKCIEIKKEMIESNLK